MTQAPALRRIVLSAAFAAASAPATALATPSAEWGGFGQAFVGGFFGGFGNLENDVAQTGTFGEDFVISPAGLQYGGGGKVLIAGTVLIIGKGMGWAISADQTQGATIEMNGGGGGFDIGWAVLNRDSNLLYPYLGVGGYGVSIDVTNKLATQPIHFGSASLAAGDSDIFSAGFFAFDFGLGYQRLLFFGESADGGGGFVVGAEAGFIATIIQGGWTNDAEEEISGLEDLGVSGGYLRVTVGGGGFTYEKHATAAEERAAAR